MNDNYNQVFENLSIDALIQHALQNQEGELAANGAFVALTGRHTGRSPKDRFIVRDSLTETKVDWAGKYNQAIDNELFKTLWQEAEAYLQDKNVYLGHYAVGADSSLQIPVTVITELAWHNLFAADLFIREVKNTTNPAFTILCAPGCLVDFERHGLNSPAGIILNFSERKILIRGTAYAGEMKKGMFSVLNFLYPDQDVLPMHCSANMDDNGSVALFFGLSGTGKTTLSADPKRHLIGDDEHGWSHDAVFNFEGGCYAKCIDLSKEQEPMIWKAIRYGAVMENVYIDPKTKVPDYHDARYTENSRAAYPREFIENAVAQNQAASAKSVIFLTCDLYGVLPPVALLSGAEAAYHFLSGYTALVGSTELGGVTGVSTTFSACFGAPFFCRPVADYAALLMKRLEDSGAKAYLVNTGWTGGAYGKGGKRFSIPVTRSIIDAILAEDILHEPTTRLPGFNLKIPTQLQGVEATLLDPRLAWQDQDAYVAALRELIAKFNANFAQFASVDLKIRGAGPDAIMSV